MGLEAQVDMEQDLGAMEVVQVVMEVVRVVLVDLEGLDLVVLYQVLLGCLNLYYIYLTVLGLTWVNVKH